MSYSEDDDRLPSMSEALVGAEAAQRLLADDMLLKFVSDLRANSTTQALYAPAPDQREAGRQIVLTLDTLLGMLKAAVELPKTMREIADREAGFE